MEEKQTRLVESSDSDIKKLVANVVPESAKKSTKYAFNVFEGELRKLRDSRLSDFILRKLKLSQFIKYRINNYKKCAY